MKSSIWPSCHVVRLKRRKFTTNLLHSPPRSNLPLPSTISSIHLVVSRNSLLKNAVSITTMRATFLALTLRIGGGEARKEARAPEEEYH